MFRLESYITPIILNHVAKYVKNIRPQDSQVSLWEGEVAFQNLDLRLDVLEEELQLPFEFLSGHIHELTIHVPWTKINSEPINITINTIEFVLKLKDQEQEASSSKEEVKKKTSKVEEAPQGYIPGLVNKIINNITIDCHNIILKYVEEDIVVSMNVQLLKLSSADESWKAAFTDINPTKVILRKVVHVSDLTICLDKRNSMGQIEVCQEPILYKCSLEIRILRKYNLASVAKLSVTKIHIFTSSVDINVSSVQFPMAMRLVALILALKSGDLMAQSHADTENEEPDDSDAARNNAQSYLSWAWNMLPSIFPTDEDESPEELESSEGHFLNSGIYIEKLSFTLKSSEYITDSIVQTTKKIRYNPILCLTLKGIFSETVMTGNKWFNTTGGVSSIYFEPLENFIDDGPFCFIISECATTKAFLYDSLFDEGSKENVGSYEKFPTDLEEYLTKVTLDYILYRAPAFGFDMISILEEKDDTTEDCVVPEKSIMRVILASTTIRYNTRLVTVYNTVMELANSYNYSPYSSKSSLLVPGKLPPPSLDDYDNLMATEIPKRIIEVFLKKIDCEIHSRTEIPGTLGTNTKVPLIYKENLPFFALNIENLVMKYTTPIYPNQLISTTCQIPNKPIELLKQCYHTFIINVKNLSINMAIEDTRQRILILPNSTITFHSIIQPELWTNKDTIKKKVTVKIDSATASYNKPQAIVITNYLAVLMEYNLEKLQEIYKCKARLDTREKCLPKIEHTLNFLNVKIKEFDDKIFCSGELKYFQSTVNIIQNNHISRRYIFRAPVDIPVVSEDSWCKWVFEYPYKFMKSVPNTVTINMSEFAVILDPTIITFLNYEVLYLDVNTTDPITVKKIASTSRPDIERSSSKKSHITSERPSRKSIIQPAETIHLSSEKEEKIEEMSLQTSATTLEKSATFKKWVQLKHLVIDLEISKSHIYIPTSPGFLTSSKCMETTLKTTNIDYALFSLPEIKFKSASNPVQSHKHTFPWTCDFTNFEIYTIFNKKKSILLHPAKTTVTVASSYKESKEYIGFNFHIDTAPVVVEISENQALLLQQVADFTIKVFNKLFSSKSSQFDDKNADQTIIISYEDDIQIKEFLAMNSDSDISAKLPLPETSSIRNSNLSVWLQWTIAKFSLSLITSKIVPTKIKFEIEDFITSIDKRSEYLKLISKVGTMGTTYFVTNSSGTWIQDDSIKVSTEISKSNETFLNLTVTIADTRNVVKKLGTPKNPTNLNQFITEIVISAQAVEIILDLHHLTEFVPIISILYPVDQDQINSRTSRPPMTVSDLPLVYVECKGFRIYCPAVTENENCNLLIFKISEISISPNVKNPLPRMAVRQDVYNKAAQMRILNTPGSKVEDRQYELSIRNISAASGNWNQIITALKGHASKHRNSNPAFEWNNQANTSSSIDVLEIFSNFELSITYAPCIVYNRILICGQAIEINCVTDLTAYITSNQITLFTVITSETLQLQRLNNPASKIEKSVSLPMQTQCVNLFKDPGIKQIKKVKNESLLTIRTNFKDIIRKNIVKKFPKEDCDRDDCPDTVLLYPDSGIALSEVPRRSSCSIQKITAIQAQNNARQIPCDISFLAGFFIFKFYHSSKPRAANPQKDNPLIMYVINQPSLLISQKTYEKIIHFSIFEINIQLDTFTECKEEKQHNEFNVACLETEQAQESLSGIRPPLLKIKVTYSKLNKLHFECNLQKPIVIHLSHRNLQRIFNVMMVLEEAIKFQPQQSNICERPIIRGTKIAMIRNFLFNIDTLRVNINNLILKIKDADFYDLKFSVTNLQSTLKYSIRPEKLIMDISNGFAQIWTQSQVLLHPLAFQINIKIIQESWIDLPFIICSFKFNLIHIDFGTLNIKNITRAHEQILSVLRQYENDMDSYQQVSGNLRDVEELKDRNKLVKIDLPEAIPKTIIKQKSEIYQDDLRAGAFQFFEVNTEEPFPLPYQIQVIMKNNGIICWRYPQPRSIARLQILPIPMETTKPIQIRCRMEYHSEPHERFLQFCDFNLSETETSIIELPQRKVTSNVWRVVILQSFVIVEGQCFECSLSSDEDEEVKSVKIEDLLNSNKNENDFRLHPKALVACMRVDTCFNPEFVPKLQVLCDINSVQLNLQNQYDSKNLQLPSPLQNCTLWQDSIYLNSHTFLTFLISKFSTHGTLQSMEDFVITTDLTLSCTCLDYSYLNMHYIIENCNIKANLDRKQSIKLKTLVDTIKFDVGPTFLHTLIAAKNHWDESLFSTSKYPILPRYIICNQTNIPIEFGQADTKEVITLKSKEAYLYSFHSDYYDQKLVFGFSFSDQKSKPLQVDEEDIQYVHINSKILTVKTEKLSAMQQCVYIMGQIELMSMSSDQFHVQFKKDGVYIPFTDTILLEKSKASFCIDGLIVDDCSFRLKFPHVSSKIWTGDIPLRSNKNLPWLVKVPKPGAEDLFVSFWVRIIQEDIPELLSDTLNMKPKRVLIIIWPMFKIQSLFTSPMEAVETSTENTIILKGRGEQQDFKVGGTHETEHSIIFHKKFVSPHGENKNKAILSFKAIDWNKFFSFDEKNCNINRMVTVLSQPLKINWPYLSDEELKIERPSSTHEKTTPIFRCLPSQEFGCSLMLEISPWCLFINSLGITIQVQDYSNMNDIQKIKSNQISSFVMIREAFIINIKYNLEVFGSLPIYINETAYNSSKKNGAFFIEEKGKSVINLNYKNCVSKFLLSTTSENGTKIFILSSVYVIVNFTKYSFNVISFCIRTSEKINKAKLYDSCFENIYVPENISERLCKGISLDRFINISDINTVGSKRSTEYEFYICFTYNKDISLPILLDKTFNRKCFSIEINKKSIPLAACVIEDNGQFYLNIYDDTCPEILIDNQTELDFLMGRTITSDTTPDVTVIREIKNDFIGWNQIIKANSELYYTPPESYNTFPDIEPFEYNIVLAIFNENISNNKFNEDNIQWSKPIRTDTSCEKYFSVPFHGDVKVVICDKHKTVRIFIFYAEEQKEFCVKDLRSRLLSKNEATLDIQSTLFMPSANSNISELIKENVVKSKKRKPKLCTHKNPNAKQPAIHIVIYMKEVKISIFVDSKQKRAMKTEILSIFIDDSIIESSNNFRSLELIMSNIQIDNQLYSTNNYDFPVILCPQVLYKRNSTMPSLNNLENEIKIYKEHPLALIGIVLYEEEFQIESIQCQLNPIRAYIEDTYLNDIFDNLIECDTQNATLVSKEGHQRQLCTEGLVLVPTNVVNKALYLSEAMRLKSIRINPMSILLSVHTCVRLYIALDHSPLEFSLYEKRNLLTLPLRFGHTLGMHYLSGALFGAGWVVGSLEILGSPSGLARSFSIGLWDFLSLPFHGLLRGPWGFVVGISQGSASLLKNVTAGTVNSVTKLAASVARNIDRLTLDNEHFQRTEALRRSRPQGFTEGLSQGLTGFGISLLGAVGGLARHPLEAKSPVQIVTGVGKGIVGAFTKPISGAAELLALTGQGMLHTVGFNAMPTQRCPTVTKKTASGLADCKMYKYLPKVFPEGQILFHHEATLVAPERLRLAIVCMTRDNLLVQDFQTDESQIFPLDSIQATFDDDDKTLIHIHLETPTEESSSEDCSFTNHRIMSYLKSSSEQLTAKSSCQLQDITTSTYSFIPRKLEISFYINEYLGQHFLMYLDYLIMEKKSKKRKQEKPKPSLEDEEKDDETFSF